MTAAHPGYLVNPRDLDLADPNLRLFDATVYLMSAESGYRAESGAAKYAERHIPGANFLDLIKAFSDTSTGLGFSLPGPVALQNAFQNAGVNDDSQVVFYSLSHMMWATRAWWLAYYAGHTDIAVLNGGLARWQSEGGEITTSSPHYPVGNFTVTPNPPRFVNAEQVSSAIDELRTCTLNALSPAVYEGSGDMHYGRRGHIPGSINLFYDELLDEGSFRPIDELRDALAGRGVPEAERIIAYSSFTFVGLLNKASDRKHFF
ncbi:MAG: rhodanese-like domain-containing protein [Pseudomonadales bacterium]|jgi:thiosulfate/3-mercaptopyruvate sulfurtransferase|nr:rhodanese-like domain-containing protein [Pseudomonadales bacterium]MDP6471930.1 rhodanese-like domain-containing protein [Pseudomonadales bacterium]MDP6826800.1 rhodanese-like domain-containing protein [Pseudomonadales bacterium]MDP6970922.1 rhodanese-like domain-containing protein [Pseudomonadales bacterium]|tara:strand:- start:3317 stop:4099 length:783 start_codon:yes stop_codon:yes gene_type:complete